MPSNKEALKRYRIIHSILRRGGKYKTSRIVEVCNNQGIPVSLRTIQNDLKDLAEDTELGFYLPIKQDKRTKTFYYEEIPKNIFPILELNSTEIDALLLYNKMVNQYKEYSIFSKVFKAVKKVIDNSNISPQILELFEKETILETEKYPSIHGIEFIPEILDSIQNRKIIEIQYTKFHGQSKKHLIKPLLLKEDKRMWYIIGINTKYESIITFALDRIDNITTTDQKFETVNFDSERYFEYSFGITVSDDEPIEVIIWFDPDQGSYLRTLPIHPTQKILKDNSKEFLISIKVKPSYEFYSKLKSYGEQAKIISPQCVSEQIQASFKKALENYNS